MQLHERYDGLDDPFEGDRTVVWCSLPQHAIVTRATLTVAPPQPPGAGIVTETLRFGSAGPAYGATIRDAGNSSVEIDFHARRRAVAFSGLSVSATSTLAVDIGGGVFLAVGPDGSIPPATPGTSYNLVSQTLPGVDALRLRLGGTSAATRFDAVTVAIVSAPSNVSLRFGSLPPFWSKTGVLASASTTPDITPALQRALAGATVVAGFYVIPIAVHSDTLGRLALTLDVEYLGASPLIGPGLREVLLPYDSATVANTDPRALYATVPAGARIVSPQTALQLRGAFDASRVAQGPTGPTAHSATVECSPMLVLAQAMVVTTLVDISAVDLYIGASSPSARLAIDLRADVQGSFADRNGKPYDQPGKPGTISLLAKPASCSLTADAAGQFHWVTVALAAPARVAAGTRIWLVVQALDSGTATLGLADSTDTSSAAGLLQQSADAGFSWRLAGTAQPLLARLRTLPGQFSMPIEFAVGQGTRLQRAGLAAYDALGKIDMVVDRPDIAAAVQGYLAQVAPPQCSTQELLQNPDFAQWSAQGGGLGASTVLTAGTVGAVGGLELVFLDTLLERSPGTSVARPRGLGGTNFGEPTVFAWDAAGTTLYVGDANGHLAAMDPGSFEGTLLPSGASLAANELAADPLGAALYVLQSDGLYAVDVAAQSRSQVFAATPAGTTVATALAISHDGATAYVALWGANPEVVAIDLAAETERYRFPFAAARLAVSADDALLIALDPNGAQVAAFRTGSGISAWAVALPGGLDPASQLAAAAIPIDVATTALGIYVLVARYPGGAAALVAAASNAVAGPAGAPAAARPGVIAAATAQLRESAIYALGPDGSVLDAADPVEASPGQLLAKLAAKPQGDRLYAAHVTRMAVHPSGNPLCVLATGGQQIASIPVGVRQPSHWSLTAGSVAPIARPDGSAGLLAALTDGALSQVVAVSPLCPHVLAVNAQVGPDDALQMRRTAVTDASVALATAPDAAADLLWRDAAGTLLRQDTLALPRSLRSVTRTLQVSPPAAAAQVEVRLRVDAGVCRLQSVSLHASDALLQEAGWVQESAATSASIAMLRRPGFAVYRNLGASDATLVQTTAVPAGALLELSVDARVLSTAGANPRIEVTFLDAAGTALAPVQSIELAAFALVPLRARLQVPPAQTAAPAASGASAPVARIRLVLPAASALRVDQLGMVEIATVDLPCTFIAQSTGALHVSNAIIAYDMTAPPPPAPPAAGLSPVTPPPGAPATGQDCACDAAAPTSSGATFGATAAATAAVRPTDAPAVRATAPARDPAPLVAEVAVIPPDLPLTSVIGIGPARARRLQAAGITSLRGLARATPEQLAAAFSGMIGIAPVFIANLAEQARAALLAISGTGEA